MSLAGGAGYGLQAIPPTLQQSLAARLDRLGEAREIAQIGASRLASLSLAKLYQSTARPADAHAVLAPILEAFRRRREMPEIAEAQALMKSLP